MNIFFFLRGCFRGIVPFPSLRAWDGAAARFPVAGVFSDVFGSSAILKSCEHYINIQMYLYLFDNSTILNSIKALYVKLTILVIIKSHFEQYLSQLQSGDAQKIKKMT